MRSYEVSAFCSRIALLQQYVISWSIWMAPGQTGQDLDVYIHCRWALFAATVLQWRDQQFLLSSMLIKPKIDQIS